MEDLQRGHISISPEFISHHINELEKEFAIFKSKIKAELKILESDNKTLIDKHNFDETGRSSIELKNLSSAEKKLKEEVIKRFSFANFFSEAKGKLHNRNEIYYATFIEEEPRAFQVIKACLYLDIMLAIFQELEKDDFVCNNFIIASLFDDIRYKFILLYEDILANDISLPIEPVEELTSIAITNYYDYLFGIPQIATSHSQLISFVNQARKFIIDYLDKFNKDLKPIRKYKEADIPIDNLMLIDKLKRNLPGEKIDCIIGIRFGGIELPYLIKKYIYPKADIQLLKISKYSDSESTKAEQEIIDYVNNNRSYFKTKNDLVVDDSITTARTAGAVINALRNKAKNVYFSCVYYSQFNRLPQMRMDGHGGVNLKELEKCCVLKETNYTASVNMKSYLGRNKKFDLTKEEIKKRLNKNSKSKTSIQQEEVVKDENTKKDFIACSQSMITVSYPQLLDIRNYFNAKKDYQIIDDWIDGPNKRKHIEDEIPIYKEVDGRDFLSDAFTDIRNSDLVILYYPAPSTYLSLLFRIAELSNKEVWIFYSRIGETKGFEKYPNKSLYQIRQLKSLLSHK
ncbi:MAG TPA: phosphoribosyltransferase [Bacteroidia bacterium]|nr:phosphoribosyltransferase [Bacteroidia bacterium]